MTQALQKQTGSQPQQKPRALEVMASKLNVEPSKLLGTLKQTVFKNATDEELLALVVVSNEYGLNPLLKELYAFPAKGGGIVPVVSVDGWNKIMTRQEDFDGIEFSLIDDDVGNPYSCTATIYLKGRTKPVVITEYFSECFRKTEPWEKMPRRMLRHKALIQASRVAFGFSGIRDEDEAIDVAATVVERVNEPTTTTKALISDTEPVAEPKSEEKSPQQALADFVVSKGFDFTAFQRWAKETGNIPIADSMSSFDEVPAADATRFLKSPNGLVRGLKLAKEAQ
jgi:phage recombination protein Bet